MKGVFKTEDQLIASGWVRYGGGQYRSPEGGPVVNRLMLRFSGQVVETGYLYDEGEIWTITERMLMSETELVEQLLKEYDE
jgi:hypothetical protein